jgi:hypothetical protein
LGDRLVENDCLLSKAVEIWGKGFTPIMRTNVVKAKTIDNQSDNIGLHENLTVKVRTALSIIWLFISFVVLRSGSISGPAHNPSYVPD